MSWSVASTRDDWYQWWWGNRKSHWNTASSHHHSPWMACLLPLCFWAAPNLLWLFEEQNLCVHLTILNQDLLISLHIWRQHLSRNTCTGIYLACCYCSPRICRHPLLYRFCFGYLRSRTSNHMRRQTRFKTLGTPVVRDLQTSKRLPPGNIFKIKALTLCCSRLRFPRHPLFCRLICCHLSRRAWMIWPRDCQPLFIGHWIASVQGFQARTLCCSRCSGFPFKYLLCYIWEIVYVYLPR